MNQQTPALANGSNMLLSVNSETITPAQKPKHKLHLNKFSNIFSFVIKLLGKFRIEPYLSIQWRPTQQIRLNVIYIFINDIDCI